MSYRLRFTDESSPFHPKKPDLKLPSNLVPPATVAELRERADAMNLEALARGRKLGNLTQQANAARRRQEVARLLEELGDRPGVQKEIAARLGISEPTVSRYVRKIKTTTHNVCDIIKKTGECL